MQADTQPRTPVPPSPPCVQPSQQRKEYEQRLEEVKRAQQEEVDEKLDASVKRVLGQNRRLAEELRLHVHVRGLGFHGVRV